MKTSIIAAATAAVLASSLAGFATSASAQNAAPATQATPASPAPAAKGPAGGSEDHGGWRPSPADRAALTDARIAAIKIGLKLTPEQEKLWPAVETTLRDVAKERAARFAAFQAERKQGAKPDAIERLRDAAKGLNARAADLVKIADAADPLYKTLDEGQKRRLQILVRQEMPRGPGHKMHEGRPHQRG
ncbi:Spy/CpxP family protein refolding chaperone [Roseixanthobacter glucoisosaccharinicivorans]|uniref:Spy/CpxP family protein refolding chaperone n=1 Tax=Roseixanthobacter glucoisosaccharinicivorans TaxID=3119923 RepID=UPI00372AFCC9